MGTSEVAAFSPFTFCPGTVIVGRLSPYTVKPGSGCGPIANGNFTPETAPTGKLKGVSRPIQWDGLLLTSTALKCQTGIDQSSQRQGGVQDEDYTCRC
jgi:hypothetical protein